MSPGRFRVVTVSREYGSGGAAIAAALASLTNAAIGEAAAAATIGTALETGVPSPA